jgi:glycosyltransferase involved in cell wall biosynthesis
LGPVNFRDLPTYAQGFDICLLNWIMADWIKNSFPVKSLEYLAMGKPIISCNIPILEEMFDSLIYFANTPEEFLSQSRRALEEDSELFIHSRMEAASRNTWDKKYRYINSITNELEN